MLKNIYGRIGKTSLLLKIATGAVLGILVGLISEPAGLSMKLLGDLFMNLVSMVIVPLIFPLIVLAIVKIRVTQEFGKLAGRTFLYFFTVTTVLIALALLLGSLSGTGAGAVDLRASAETLEGIASSIDFNTFVLGLVPSNFIRALSEGNLLPIIFFAVFLGVALSAIGEKAQPVLDFFDSWTEAMFKVADYAFRFAPVGVFGFLAYDIASYGVENVASLGGFVLWTYIAYGLAAFGFYPLLAAVFRVPYFPLLRQIGDLALTAFSTGSSSAVLPPLLERLKKYGIPERITSFVTPLGYSFNLGGAGIYISMAVMFVANLYGAAFSVSDFLVLILFLTIITKSIATVPSGALVVLLASAAQMGLPEEGVALLVSIDFFVNAGRTALNVVGNALAPAILAQMEARDTGVVPQTASGQKQERI